MNADQLLAHYERIAEAPDAIARLRQFVLDLAVRGKLVEQTATDNPASELLKRVALQKARLIKEKTIKRSDVDPITTDEMPYAVPTLWQWARLGDIGDWGAGSTPSRGSADLYGGGVTWLKSGELNDNTKLAGSEETVTEMAVRKGSFRLNKPGDVLIAMYGATIGKLAILAEVAVTNQAVCGCTPFDGISNRFLFLFLLAQREAFHAASEGGAQPNISKVKIVWTPCPVPPLAEQHRIVAKVDELMALCDRLEEARKERETARDRLTAASLARLNAPDPDPATFTTHARFALDSLTKLSSQHRQIAQWRATIIELATRGKLSLENANDTPPAKALEAINDARDALVHAKLLRREKPLTAVRKEEVPFQAPGSWLWTRLGEVALFTQYGTSLKAEQSTIGVPVLTMGNIQSGAVVPAKEKRISSQSSELPELYLKKFDLLYNRTNSPELVGKTGIYLGNDDCVTFASYLIRLRFVADHTDPHFINLAMNAPGFRSSQISPYIKQQTGQANVNGTAMKNMLIALPPIEEQRRIVAKVDELMALCGRLETCLATGDETRQRLLEAILHEALEPAKAQELEPA